VCGVGLLAALTGSAARLETPIFPEPFRLLADDAGSGRRGVPVTGRWLAAVVLAVLAVVAAGLVLTIPGPAARGLLLRSAMINEPSQMCSSAPRPSHRTGGYGRPSIASAANWQARRVGNWAHRAGLRRR